MTTTVKKGNKYVPFDDALKRARIRYLCGNRNPQTTEEMEKRRDELREYIGLSKIQKFFRNGIHIEYR